MTQTYIHKDLGKILIYYSPKARSIRVQVGDNGIKLIIPLGVNIDKGLHFVNAKQDWIEKALKRTEQKKETCIYSYYGIKFTDIFYLNKGL